MAQNKPLSLYDLAMQYLNQSVPKAFKYDRTNPPTIGPRLPVQPEDPNAPIKRILPVQGGGDGFSVYNPDPNMTRGEDNYNERPYKSALYNDAFPMMGDPMANQATGALNADGLMSYPGDKPPTGIGGLVKNSLLGKGLTAIGNMLPVNRTGILQNELLGAGFQLNDIGQIVGDPRTVEGVMAGMNTSRMDSGSFDRKSEGIENTLSEKYGLSQTEINSIKAGNITDTIKEKTYNPTMKTTTNLVQDLLNTQIAKDKFEKVIDKTTTVFDAKSLARDPTYKNLDQLVTEGLLEGDDDDDDGEVEYDPLDPLNLNTTTAPGFKNFYNPYERDNIVDVQRTKDAIEEARLRDLDAMDPNPNTNNKGFDPGVTPGESGFIGLDKDMDIDIRDIDGPGTYDGPGMNDPIGPSAPDNTPNPGDTDTFNRETGNENDSGSNKIVCTMMNESYGFGSFRNKIWMKFHKDLSPEYQKGYHKLFLPLVRIAKTNKVVKKILEHIAVHSTIDMRQATRGKMHLLGRIYRKILLPLCYFVGKHG